MQRDCILLDVKERRPSRARVELHLRCIQLTVASRARVHARAFLPVERAGERELGFRLA